MSIRVCLRPTPETHPANNGIGRVVHAQWKLLPQYDIELVKDPLRADVCSGHTNQHDMPRSDVLSVHGLYWSGDPQSGVYGQWNHNINKEIISVARRSPFITVPTQWVAECFRRDMRISPVVIPHGVDSELWVPSNRIDSYILWNKNRGNVDVCDPMPAHELAKRGYHVISTFAPKGTAIPDNMSVTGEVPEVEMRDLVSHAHLYLATTKETFGIGTLEALACGVPVVGFDWGGTRDLITNKVDGVLVRPYDYDALQEACNFAHEHRQEMGEAAREKAKRYTWQGACELYADVYRRAAAHNLAERENSGVAIVVTSYNYGHYLAECLRSILSQSVKPSEVVVVDDCSQDDTTEVANEFAQRFSLEGIGYRVITHKANAGVATARNHGVDSTDAAFVTCLDADDRINPLYVSACKDALSRDRGVGVAYTGLGLIRSDGRVTENMWTGSFDWEWQATSRVPPATCIPTAAMFRRSAWEKCGGYRQRYAPGEDAEFYTRLLSLGHTAIKVTESPLIEYRNHGQGAHLTRQYIAVDDDKPWMRDRMYPMGAPSERPPLVRSYSDPLVAVHIDWREAAEIRDTLDSLIGQTWREWEAIIETHEGTYVNISKGIMKHLYPFLKDAKSAPLCIRIDAGVVLPSDYLETEIRAFIARGDNHEWDGGSRMASCCGGKIDATQLARMQAIKQGELHALDLPPTPTTASALAQATLAQPEYVRMEFIGRQVGAATYFGKQGSGRVYRAGNNDLERYVNVHRDDVELLRSKGIFKLVALNPVVVTEVKHEPVVEPTAPPRGAWDRGITTVAGTPSREDSPVVGRTGDSQGARENAANALPAAVQRPAQEVKPPAPAVDESVIPAKFRRIELPPELVEDVPPTPVDAPITVHVERLPNEEDDAAYDRRVRAAIEAEKRRRANG